MCVPASKSSVGGWNMEAAVSTQGTLEFSLKPGPKVLQS